MTEDKRCVTDFKHLVFSSFRDTFCILGILKHETLNVLDLKNVYQIIILS